MNLKWTDIAFWPDDELANAAAQAWRWLVPEPWSSVVCSIFGGLFLEKSAGGVFWLECATGEIERVADNRPAFEGFLRAERNQAWDEQIDNWFLPGLVERSHEVGKRPGPGQCLGFTILPIFQGGVYEPDNIFVVSAREWLTHTGSIHEQLRDVPDGGQVRLKVVD